MSESVTVQTGHTARLHSMVMEGDYLVRWDLLPSRQLDPTARWIHTPRLWDLPIGAIVENKGDCRTWQVTPEGTLAVVGLDDAKDALDPAGSERRAVADHLKRSSVRLRARTTLERLQGHDLGYVEGVHAYETPEVTTVLYAERVTPHQAWIRCATRAEAEAAGFRFVVGPKRDVTVLSLSSLGGHDVDEAGAGLALDTGHPSP